MRPDISQAARTVIITPSQPTRHQGKDGDMTTSISPPGIVDGIKTACGDLDGLVGTNQIQDPQASPAGKGNQTDHAREFSGTSPIPHSNRSSSQQRQRMSDFQMTTREEQCEPLVPVGETESQLRQESDQVQVDVDNTKIMGGGTGASAVSHTLEKDKRQGKTREETIAKKKVTQVQAITGVTDSLKERSRLKKSERITYAETSTDQSRRTAAQVGDKRYCWYHQRFKGRAWLCKDTKGGKQCQYLVINGGTLAKKVNTTRKNKGDGYGVDSNRSDQHTPAFRTLIDPVPADREKPRIQCRTIADSRLCWFHGRFGERAFKCKLTESGKPCQYYQMNRGSLVPTSSQEQVIKGALDAQTLRREPETTDTRETNISEAGLIDKGM